MVDEIKEVVSLSGGLRAAQVEIERLNGIITKNYYFKEAKPLVIDPEKIIA